MLIGEYKHTIDAKKRLAIPAKLRKELGKGAVLTRGLDNCLTVYPLKQWQEMASKLSELPTGQSDARGYNRIILAGAVNVEFDKLGRILVPEYLKSYASLKKNVVIAGVYNRLEISDESKWQQYKENIEKDVGKIAERLGDFGV